MFIVVLLLKIKTLHSIKNSMLMLFVSTTFPLIYSYSSNLISFFSHCRYCYYCLRTRCASASSYRCARCNEAVTAMQRYGLKTSNNWVLLDIEVHFVIVILVYNRAYSRARNGTHSFTGQTSPVSISREEKKKKKRKKIIVFLLYID